MINPQEGLSYYEIINNPELLKKMTCEGGEELTYSEMVAKLERLMARKKRKGQQPPEILK